MIKKGDKRGLEMAINTIIIIILAIVVLIALVFIFSKSATGFRDKVLGSLSSSNVDLVVNDCNNLASQDSKYEYCCVSKTIKLSRSETLQLTCSNASLNNWGKDIQKLNCENIC